MAVVNREHSNIAQQQTRTYHNLSPICYKNKETSEYLKYFGRKIGQKMLVF